MSKLGSAGSAEMSLDMKKLEQDLRWEPWKALAAFIATSAAFVGATLGLASWLSHHPFGYCP
jgi:hypothetical protein